MHKTLFWHHQALPIKIERYEFPIEKLPIGAAQSELEKYIKDRSDADSNTWGYFPETKPDDTEYPATVSFVNAFERELLSKVDDLKDVNVQLAFVRRATAEPVSNFGGFHIDASAGISHAWPEDVPKDMQVLRMLFNIGDQPRKLEFYPHTVEQLRQKGIIIPRDHYVMLNDLSQSLKTESIDIPPIEDNALYGLTFVSTMVPHAGKTSGEGHFLISYGAYITNQRVARAYN